IDPKQPLKQVLVKLPDLMIRNNKQSVTDMRGNKLFQPVTVQDVQYSHSREEERFYTRLTEFILTGKAYAGGLQLGTQRSVMLVLTTMQKLAASSVAAVRRALEGRLDRLRNQEARRVLNQAELNDLWRKLVSDKDGEGIDPDLRATLEERIDELMEAIQLNPDEIPAIEELVSLASEVRNESRILKLVELVDSFSSDRSVLMFTEYKATQALIVSALTKRHGADQVTFINGDGALFGVLKKDGTVGMISSDRYEATRQFNSGKVRFLVSTEAGGEGIDLQARCYTLIHADLPWNPMRMHQRAGRLNRYGQKQAVEVFLLRNPATVEGRIWACLERKLERISLALAGAMADPEDIRLLVLGLASPAFHEQVASRSIGINTSRFDNWYDAETASFGGAEAIEVVRALIGNTASFDFATDAPGLPQVDLPDLLPFLRAALRFRGRRLEEKEDGTFMFLTPELWAQSHHTIRDRYIAHLDRNIRKENNDAVLLGAGHRVIEAALEDASGLSAFAASLPDLDNPLVLFSCQDDLSMPDAPIHRVIIGAELEKGNTWKPIKDWEILLHLNRIVERPDRPIMRSDISVAAPEALSSVEDARKVVENKIPSLNLPFQRPSLRLESVLWSV
nr:SWF/SNF helicase family protein [Candidatus Desulfatibia profunda]